MGTQVGNATPVDEVAAAATDTPTEGGASEATSSGDASWTDTGGVDY